VISHGLGEHSGSYEAFAQELGGLVEVDLVGADYRGHGRSSGARGVVRTYDDLRGDLSSMLAWTGTAYPGLPRFLLGHSNGGLVALQVALGDGQRLTGLILSNPSIQLKARVPGWKKLVGEILHRVAPSWTLKTGLSDDELTRDPQQLQTIAADPLRHDRISPPLYFGMVAEGAAMQSKASALGIPTLIVIGEADPIIDPASTRAFFDQVGSRDKTLIAYPEMRHEPFNELGRERVIGDIARWISERI
jgi:alpha-beta hydrolase superfamily lysophospholipase